MYFTTIAAGSLSLLLSTSISVLGATIPKNVTGDDIYSLTLESDPNTMLVADFPNVKVETFNETEPWNATDVGPDNNRRWNVWDGMASLHNVGTNGFLSYDNASALITTDGQLSWLNTSSISLVPTGNGIHIKLHDHFERGLFSYVNELGKSDKQHAAIWLLTKTKGVPP